jgi:hypothetical protein
MFGINPKKLVKLLPIRGNLSLSQITSRYSSNPNNNPNIQPTSTYVINNANPLSPNPTDINNGYIRLLMKPQPSSIDPIFGGWFSLNVKCNGLCNTDVVTKYYFFIPPP